MSTGIVTNVQRFSLHDGGGIRTVGFLKGCPFRCPWCCNPENLSFEPELAFHKKLCIGCSEFPPGERLCVRPVAECPTGAKELLGTRREAGEFAQDLMRDRIFFEESGGGVTLSGGECLAGRNLPFALETLTACHEAGVRTAVETTLAVPLTEADQDALAAVVDDFLVDFKIADAAKSRRVIGLNVELRDRNLAALLARGAHVVARMPIIPGYTDSRENVEANLNRASELGIREVDVLPFHQLGEAKYEAGDHAYTMSGTAQLNASDVTWIKDLAQEMGLSATIGGT